MQSAHSWLAIVSEGAGRLSQGVLPFMRTALDTVAIEASSPTFVGFLIGN